MNKYKRRRIERTNAHGCARRSLLALVIIGGLSAEAAAQKPMMSVDKDLPLSAEQTAETIGLLPLFARIKELQSPSNDSEREERIEIQQQILLNVTSASLQVEAATGQIDAEIADTRELESYLIGRRDSKADLLNLASLGVGGTAGTANSVLGFTNHDVASAVTSAVAGGVTLGFSIWELKTRGDKRECLRHRATCSAKSSAAHLTAAISIRSLLSSLCMQFLRMTQMGSPDKTG